MKSLVLLPFAQRSGEKEKEFEKTAETRLVELRLPWIQRERFSSYRVQVLSVDGDESFIIANLQAEDDGAYRIRIRLPARLLRRGYYRVRLTGITPDGSAGLTEEYTFAVSE
jgi:hypothetical protein